MAGGHSQREEIDFKGTFAPIAKFVSLRVLLIRNLTVNKQISSLHSCTVIWKRQYTSGPLTTVSSAWQCLIYSVWDATPFPKHPAQTRGGGGVLCGGLHSLYGYGGPIVSTQADVLREMNYMHVLTY